MTTVAVVTPWFNHPELWDDYWDAVRVGEPDELIVVDNNSDPPLDFAILRLQANLGFSGGSNRGLKHATSDAVLFLNNDIADGSTGWLNTIRDALEPGVLVGAQLRSDPHAWIDGVVMPYLDGWCLAGMRDDLNQLGGFDEGLLEPAYFSDNLLCLEARAAGMTLREVKVPLRHKGGATSQPTDNPDVHRVTVANQQRYQQRARQLLTAA